MKKRNMILMVALMVAVMARAGSHTAQSAAFTVDTRDGIKPVVQDVISNYCDQKRRAYFLSGVPVVGQLTVNFFAVVDWNGKEPGSIKFTRVKSDGIYGSYGNLTGEQTFDISSFEVGEILKVKAVAKDGTSSTEEIVNFRMITPPKGLNPNLFFPVMALGNIKYQSADFSFKPFDVAAPVSSRKAPPFLDGKTVSFSPEFSCSVEVDSFGRATETMQIGVGVESAIKCRAKLFDIPIFGKGAKKGKNYRGSVSLAFDWAGSVKSTFNEQTGYWGMNSGSFGVVFPFDLTSPRYPSPWPPPLSTICVTCKGEFRINAVAVQGPANSIEWSGVAPGQVGLSIADGYYFDAFVFEVYGAGSANWKLQVTQPSGLTELGGGLKVGVRIKIKAISNFEFDIKFFDYNWPDRTGAMPSALFDLPNLKKSLDVAEFKLISRKYQSSAFSEFGQPVRLLSLQSEVLPAPLSQNVNATLLQGNVYPYSEPSVCVNGSDRMLLWISDDPVRSDVNRTKLVCSKWVGSNWAEPTSVWDEGTADYSPVVAALPTGKAMAAWQNEQSSLTNGASLQEALGGMEIAVAKYDPVSGSWEGTNLTSNLILDHSPRLVTATNGTALVSWISNASNSPCGSITSLNVIMACRWNGTSWGMPAVIADGTRMVLGSTLSYNGSNALFVATVDGDDDSATSGDQELYGATYNGTMWSAFTRLTDNAVEDSNPQAIYSQKGEWSVTWNQGSNIVRRVGDMNLALPEFVCGVGAIHSAKDFRLVTGATDQFSLLWEDLDKDGTGPDPFLLNYDPTLRVWSEPIRLLNNSNLLERSFSAAYATNGSLLMAYNQVLVQTDVNGYPDLTNTVVDLMFLESPIGGDLGLDADSISVLTTNPVPGQAVCLSADVYNFGELAATNVVVSFYNGNPANGGLLLATTQIVSRLLAGASTNVTAVGILPNPLTNGLIYAVVDPAQVQNDRNRLNNTNSLEVLLADLAFDSHLVENESTNVRLVKASILNQGIMAVPEGVKVGFSRGSPDGTLLSEESLGALQPGTNGVYDVAFRWDMSGQSFTSAFEVVYISVDPSNTVAEIDERNNTAAVQVMTSLDTDGDGLLDGEEQRLGTRVDLADTDGDGLSDMAEVRTHGTNPLLKDSDGDGADDDKEIAAGTDPNSATDIFKIVSSDGTERIVMSVTWNAKAGRTYQVESAPLVTGPWSDSPSVEQEFGSSLQAAVTNGTLRYCDMQLGMTNRFYRVKLITP